MTEEKERLSSTHLLAQMQDSRIKTFVMTV